jgi:hypothetical protein
MIRRTLAAPSLPSATRTSAQPGGNEMMTRRTLAALLLVLGAAVASLSSATGALAQPGGNEVQTPDPAPKGGK